MANYLTNDQINDLIDAIMNAGMTGTDARDELLAGINIGFVAWLPRRGADLSQIQSDLMELNKVPYLMGGEVPLRTWLENGVHRLRRGSRPEQTLFQDMLNRVASDSQDRLAAASGTFTAKGGEALEQIIHQDDMLKYGWLQGALAVGNSVARLVVPPGKRSAEVSPRRQTCGI